jgi:hypothetical protein
VTTTDDHSSPITGGDPPLLVDQLRDLLDDAERDGYVRPDPTPFVDGQGRDLLARHLDDPDPRVRAACEAAIIRLPSDTNYTEW